jgi:hypothetical protein
MTTLTLAKLIADAKGDLDEWISDHDGKEVEFDTIDSIATDHTPVMTTVLFQLVVEDNSLAFEDSDIMSSEPFAVLSSAVHGRITKALNEHVKDLV